MTHMKKNILVVDDSALMRRVMCDIINSDSKFQATDYCRDGLEAYEKLKHTSYDGVVLDVKCHARLVGSYSKSYKKKAYVQMWLW